MNIKSLGEKLFMVESFSKPGRFYVVDLLSKVCSCPAFKFYGSCKHLKAMKEQLKNFEELKKSIKEICEDW